jgi:hypothetical protein
MPQENGPAATFERADESNWRALVEQSSRGRELDSLAGRTDDGLAIGPIYGTPEKPASFIGKALNTPWLVVQRMDDPDPERAEKSQGFIRRLRRGLSRAWYWFIALVFIGTSLATLIMTGRLISLVTR